MNDQLQARFAGIYSQWHDRLLDLSARNQLLHFKPGRSTTIEITTPSPRDLFDRLVVQEQALRFPLFSGRLRAEAGEGDEHGTRFAVKAGDLETAKEPPDLERALLRLQKQERTSLDERGVNTLYLALGMLEWRESDSTVPQLAPLIMVPIELSRANRLDHFELTQFDEDPETNPTLALMLSKDFGLAIPSVGDDAGEPLTSGAQLDDYFRRLEVAVSGQDWRVLRAAWLGQFQFRKIAMYRDLLAHGDVAASQPVLQAVARVATFADEGGDYAPVDIDSLHPTTTFSVLDADSSQMEAIARAQRGDNLIIQGPPGTGKTQTIANLIAQLMGDGKSVLFVCEKMTALSQVHKRLQGVGLGEFALELHSDRASKRAVIEQIQAAWRADVPTNRSASDDLQRLVHRRQQLNGYVAALHRPSSLGRTAFDIHGKLAGFYNAPDVRSRLPLQAESMTDADLDQLRDITRKLVHLPGVAADFQSHPWYGSPVSEWTVGTQEELSAWLGTLIAQLEVTADLAEALAGEVSIPPPSSIAELPGFRDLLELVTQSPLSPLDWLTTADLAVLSEKNQQLGVETAGYDQAIASLANGYTSEVFTLDGAALQRSCTAAVVSLVDRSTSIDEVFAQSRDWVELITVIAGLAAEVDRRQLRVSGLLGVPPSYSLGDTTRFQRVLDLLAERPAAIEAWFDWQQINDVQESAKKGLSLSTKIPDDEAIVREQWNEAVLTDPIDVGAALAAARQGWMGRLMPGGYRQISGQLKKHWAGPTGPGHRDIVRVLENLNSIRSDGAALAVEAERILPFSGTHRQGRTIEWASLVKSSTTVGRILAELGGQRPPAALIDTILRPENHRQTFAEAAAASQEIRQLSRRLGEARTAPAWLVSRIRGESQIVSELATDMEALQALLRRWHSAVAEVSGCSSGGASLASPSEVCQSVDMLQGAQTLKASVEGRSDDLRADFGRLFAGLRTDRVRVDEGLAWAARVREKRQSGELNDECLGRLVDPDVVSFVARGVPPLQVEIERLNGTWVDSARWLTIDEVRPAGVLNGSGGLRGTLDWLIQRQAEIGRFSEWVRFVGVRKEAARLGLDAFIDELLVRRVPPPQFEPALERRILNLQLDERYKAEPYLANFDPIDHQRTLDEFVQLDGGLQRAHARRIAARIKHDQPHDGTQSGQVAFLRGELAKQKRHVSVRRLFRQSGRAILKIAPCLLMSPLSVATHLEKDVVDFDVVVFDEASQMPPEEAAVAILRAKQIVVAGDSQQLPPTRFFERMNDDDEDDDDDAYAPQESILGECLAAGIPEVGEAGSPGLLWHYRSKDDSLIQFSNQYFYNNRLIVFPPAMVPGKRDSGVRFHYVEGGVYDRGKSATNRIEARAVAQLVVDHVRRYGTQRSLGVIALSIKQADAIEAELRVLVEPYPDVEPLLFQATGSAEPFFIKPLENVQGDERDSIILSIGYGRDQNGRLSMNFGPLNQVGGDRRLNVAVSRAKHLMTVVASIRWLDVEATQDTVGRLRLREYLQFAEEGRFTATTGLTRPDTESPFEEAVAAKLESLGYVVHRQVGVSRYRVDLAIVDPESPGRYLIGIECDGASYHSARGARDRDRLRQQMLEANGWRIHRVWSTEWARNQTGSIAALVAAIDDCGKVVPGDGQPAVVPEFHDAEPAEDIGAELSTNVEERQDVLRAGPATYRLYDRRAKPEYWDADAYRAAVMCEVVDCEGPIHQELLTVRMREVFQVRGSPRLTATVGADLDEAIKSGTLVRSGSFVARPTAAPVGLRLPSDGSPQRRIKYLAPTEVRDGIRIGLSEALGLQRDEAAEASARKLGYGRTGRDIQAAINHELDILMAEGVIVEKAGTLIWTEQSLRTGVSPP